MLCLVNELDLRAGAHFHLPLRLDIRQETYSLATIPVQLKLLVQPRIFFGALDLGSPDCLEDKYVIP